MSEQLVRRGEGLPPKLTDEAIDALVENISQFEKFKQRALGPKDFSQFGDNQYIEKTGWVKLGMALNISFRLVSDLTKVISQDEEGEYYLWHVRGQATTPHGRIIEMDGACTSRDEFFSMANGQRKPTSQIDEKDILATCETNAFNRCMAFLCGFGELSGEEMRGKQFAKKPATFPFGDFKGKEPSALELADLHRILPFWEKQAADPTNKFATANKRLVAAIHEALAEKTAKPDSPAAPADPVKAEVEGGKSTPPPAGDLPPLEQAWAQAKELLEVKGWTDAKVTLWCRKTHGCGKDELDLLRVQGLVAHLREQPDAKQGQLI